MFLPGPEVKWNIAGSSPLVSFPATVHTNPPMDRFDLFVIGTGPAGQKAAIQAAKLGKRVGICDRRTLVGGVCLNTGTIPSKTLREAVLYMTGGQRKHLYGRSNHRNDYTIGDLLSRCHHVIEREVDVIEDQMDRNHVTVLHGMAEFRDPHTLIVDDGARTATVEADYIVIATGTIPAKPKGVEVDGKVVITSEMVLGLEQLPRSMTVVGAGVVGAEYASIFAALGVKITLVDQRERLLEFVDAEIIEFLKYQMRDMNCIFRLGEEVDSVEIDGAGHAVAVLKSGKKIVSDLLLYSVGRMGATPSLKLELAGLKADDRGRLKVNEVYQTGQPHIYAAGDVIGFPSLASTSMEQGRLAACSAFGIACNSIPALFPYGIYTLPEISMVGKSEEMLTSEGVPYEIGLARYREIARGVIVGDDSGLLKLIFHRENRKILGVHIIGTSATELIHIGQAVLAMGGTLDYFVNTVFNYPTFAECYKVAALDGYNKIGPAPGDVPPPGSGIVPAR